MKILFLSETFPHSRVISGVINVHKRILLLAQRGHQVGLAAFLRPAETRYVPELRPVLHELELLPPPAHRHGLRCLADYAVAAVPAPFCAARDAAMRRLVGRLVEQSHYDIVIAEFSVMGQYLFRNPYLPPVRRVISCHSCLTTSLNKAVRMQPYALEAWRKRLQLYGLPNYEFAMYRSADLVLTLTPEEQFDLLRYAPDLRVAVVPYGVDVAHFRPRPAPVDEECLVCTGYFRQEPNRDAVLWFVRTVWPKLRVRWPNLKFYVVGSGPTRAMLALAQRDPRIVVTGEVADVADYLARARLYVCPMRLGTGFRGKILQAMAAGVPVVATTLAAEGIPAQTGASLMLADTPHTLEESISLLLGDPDLRARMAAQARDLVVSRFAWSHCVDLLEQNLRDLLR